MSNERDHRSGGSTPAKRRTHADNIPDSEKPFSCESMYPSSVSSCHVLFSNRMFELSYYYRKKCGTKLFASCVFIFQHINNHTLISSLVIIVPSSDVSDYYPLNHHQPL